MGAFPKAATVACCAAYCSLLTAQGAIRFAMPIVLIGIAGSWIFGFVCAMLIAKREEQRIASEENALKSAMEAHSLLTRLNAVQWMLEKIVVTQGEDAGVILLSSDSPTHYDADKRCQVYDNEYFSPLGKALVSVASVARGEGAIL